MGPSQIEDCGLLLLPRLTHSERDVASKRVLIETYKTRINELETNLIRANEKPTNHVCTAFRHMDVRSSLFAL